MGAEMWPLRPDRYYADEDYLRDPEDGTREFYHDPTKIDPLLGKRPLLIWLEDLKDRHPKCQEVYEEMKRLEGHEPDYTWYMKTFDDCNTKNSLFKRTSGELLGYWHYQKGKY